MSLPSTMLTVKLNVVVLVTPPPVAVTVMVELPAGVEAVVLTVNVEEQVGLQLSREKEAVAPVGRPAAENDDELSAPRHQRGADRIGHRMIPRDRIVAVVAEREVKGRRRRGISSNIVISGY